VVLTYITQKLDVHSPLNFDLFIPSKGYY
jgi:hypothetical protein